MVARTLRLGTYRKPPMSTKRPTDAAEESVGMLGAMTPEPSFPTVVTVETQAYYVDLGPLSLVILAIVAVVVVGLIAARRIRS